MHIQTKVIIKTGGFKMDSIQQIAISQIADVLSKGSLL